jgi:hypothetical protein
VPDPGLGEHATLAVYSPLFGPYSSRQLVTFPPFGLTVAFKVTVVCAIDEAEPVVTVGGLGSVLNVASAPWLLPPAFVAITRK